MRVNVDYYFIDYLWSCIKWQDCSLNAHLPLHRPTESVPITSVLVPIYTKLIKYVQWQCNILPLLNTLTALGMLGHMAAFDHDSGSIRYFCTHF